MYFESFYRLFITQKPFEKPLHKFKTVVTFFIFYKQRRQVIESRIEQEFYRYRSLQGLAENTIHKQSTKINIQR